VAVVVLATLLASIVWLSQRTPEYKATARLLINPLPQTDEFLGLPVIRDSGDPTRTSQTAATLLESPEAARATANRLGAGWSGQKVLGAVDLQPEGESNILAVTARADSSETAVNLANTFTAETLRARNAAVREEVAPIIARLNQTRARLGPTDPSAAEIGARIVALEELAEVGDPSTELSREAGPSASVEGAPAWLVVILALMAGVVLASVAALLKEMLGPRIVRSERELEDVDQAPVLAHIPERIRSWGARPQSPLATPPSVLTSFRSLEFQLGGPRAILFTSPCEGDGTTTCVIDFALELASSGQEVVLLDLDLREPELALRLGAAGEDGLRAVLTPGAPLDGALVTVPSSPEIKVLPGTNDAERATLEDIGRRLPDLIAEARAGGAYVLLDTSALGEIGDALRFVQFVDDVVLVARLDHTTVAGVALARDLLDGVGKPPRGYVLVGDSRGGLGERRRRSGSAVPRASGRGSGSPVAKTAEAPAAATTPSLSDLVGAGILPHDAELVAHSNGRDYVARLHGEQIDLNGTRYGSLSAAAASITGRSTNGWTFWHTRFDNQYVRLAELRKRLARRD
jgi:Mrp family chromosome partitioning ATPase/capsular polysaccharide biosynthesis protein